MKSATWSIHSMYCFLSSMQCCLTVFYHSRTLSKLDSIISNLATVFPNKFLEHSKSYAIISTIFLASSLAIDPTARKQFCSVCLWFFFSHPFKFYHMTTEIDLQSLVLLRCPPHMQLLPSRKS